MDVRIGDAVRFISEKLEGTVTAVAPSGKVTVYCEELGFDLPAREEDLVVVRREAGATGTSPGVAATSSGGMGTSSGSVSGMAAGLSGLTGASPGSMLSLPAWTGEAGATAGRLCLAIVPGKPNDLPGSPYGLFLLNDTGRAALFAASLAGDETERGVAAGSCDAGRVASIGIFSLTDLDAARAVRVQAVFHATGVHEPFPVVDATVRLNAASLCKSGAYGVAPLLGRLARLFPLDGAATPSLQGLLKGGRDLDPPSSSLMKEGRGGDRKARVPGTSGREAPPAGAGTMEVDLHAESLLDTLAGMESRDILEYQLEVFRRTLEQVKLKRGQRVVFIHGKGDGVLRQRIIWELQTKYKRFQHQDASFKQYGHGATMVTIR
ncbi:MAG: DUF2027 domain-containing protein [Odoribacteraceae bacterium]|nr:DUF2027 domain-containing protein [Odoribacteraceae bacterium]